MKNFKLNTFVALSLIVLFSSSLLANPLIGNSNIDKDIVGVAIDAGSFSTLATALTEADLVETLKQDGPFTVFAPTDEAFAKLPEGTLENLLKDKDALIEILKYHVVSGKFMASDVIKYSSAQSISKEEFSITQKDGKVFVNNSEIISADVKASNGVIHIIDSVLIPNSK